MEKEFVSGRKIIPTAPESFFRMAIIANSFAGWKWL
jgi:hypothetical protein